MRLAALVETSEGGLVWVGASPDADRGADPEVSGVVTTDLLDPGRYLAGGELVLTGLAWWRAGEPARTEQFVQVLVRCGVAALGAGEAELGTIPPDVAAACRRAGLPLLLVPVAVSFASVVARAERYLSPRRSGELAAVLGRHRALVSAAVGRVGEGSGLGGVIDMVAADLGLRCWVLSPTGRLLAGADPVPDQAERLSFAQRYARALRLPCLVRRSGGSTVTLLRAGLDGAPRPRVASWLLVIDEDHRDWGPVRRGVVDELVALVALELDLAGRRPAAEVQLAQAVAGGSADAVPAALRRCGLDPDSPSVVVVGFGPAALPVLVEALAAEAGPSAVAEAGDEVVAVIATTDPPEAVVARLREVVSLLGPALGDPPLAVGVSDPVTGGPGLLAALAEARAVAQSVAAASANAPVGAGSIAGPDRLSSHTLLLTAMPADLRSAYRSRVLGPLLEHDRRHRTDLVRTLAAYLSCSGSWSRCAAQLHVHVNTVRYRVARIEELTGRDLRRLDDQVDLLLALRIPPDGT